MQTRSPATLASTPFDHATPQPLATNAPSPVTYSVRQDLAVDSTPYTLSPVQRDTFPTPQPTLNVAQSVGSNAEGPHDRLNRAQPHCHVTDTCSHALLPSELPDPHRHAHHHAPILMAVKQVELPTGSVLNEERKKSMLSALKREVELLKELQHDNIVQYLDSSSDGVHLNIFFEYLPGGSVATFLKNYGAFEEALARNFVLQTLQGLNYLHEHEIIHRDIRGANILVDNKGGIKISDFGISKMVEDSILTSAHVHRPSLQGSVFWMAPEVVKQALYTLKADIWSVGCLVVEMLTGEHPWHQLTQMQAIFKIGSSTKPAFPSDISADAEDFLNRTFELDHNLRPSASELLLHPWIITDPANPTSAVNNKPVAEVPPTVTVTADQGAPSPIELLPSISDNAIKL